MSETMHRFSPATLFTREDLPTLGLPMTATLDDLSLVLLFHFVGENIADAVQQVAGSVSVDRGHHHQVPRPRL